MKFTKEEIAFLKKNKENFEKGDTDAILADYKSFGSYQKLLAILKDITDNPANFKVLAKAAGIDASAPKAEEGGVADWSDLYDKLVDLANSL